MLIDPHDIEDIGGTLIEILQGKYPLAIMRQPEQLRQQMENPFGFKRFERTLLKYLDGFWRQQASKTQRADRS